MKNIIKFLFKITYKSIFLIIISTLLLILPFVIIALNLTINISPLIFAGIWLGVFAILTFILILGLCIQLVVKTKWNSTDSILYTKAISKMNIFLIKLTYISAWIFLVNIISSIIMFIGIGVMSGFNIGVSYFGSSIVLTILLILFFAPIILLISLKFNEILSTILSISVLAIFVICMLVPLVVPATNNNELIYNPKIEQNNYVKYRNNDSNDLLTIVEKNSNNSNINVDYKNNVNSINLYNNFLPSQWIMSSASSIFNNNIDKLEYDNIKTNNLSLLRAIQKNSYAPNSIIDFNNPVNNIFINVGDLDIFEMNYDDLKKLILDKYENIFKNYKEQEILNLKDALDSIETLQPNDNTINLLPNQLKLFNQIIGVDNEYRELFYFTLYINRFPNIINFIENKTSSIFYSLINTIMVNNSVRENMYFKNKIVDFDDIKNTFYIPFSIDDNYEPALLDIDLIKNKILILNDDLSVIKLLTKNNTYTNIDKLTFNNVFPNIKSLVDWNNYVENNSNILQDLKLIYNNLKKLDSANIFEMAYSPNVINSGNILMFQSLEYTTLLDNSWAFSFGIVLMSIMLWCVTLKYHQKIIFAY